MLNDLSSPNVALDATSVKPEIPSYQESQISVAALIAAHIMHVVIDTPKLFVVTIDEIRRRVDPKIIGDRSDDFLGRIIHSLILAGWLEPSGRGWVLTGSLARAAVRCRQLLHDLALRAERQSVDLYSEPGA
jgi:hypothetical protein